MQTSKKILIVDDHSLFRLGLITLLERAGFACVEAADGDSAIEASRAEHPDLILMDMTLWSTSGADVCRQIKQVEEICRIPVLMLTVHEDEWAVRSAIQAGASGYLLKQTIASRLLETIHAFLRGEMDYYLDPSLTHRLKNLVQPSADIEEHAKKYLHNEREKEILSLLALDNTTSQIAAALGLRPRTVEKYQLNLWKKLGLQSRTELVRYAKIYQRADK